MPVSIIIKTVSNIKQNLNRATLLADKWEVIVVDTMETELNRKVA